MFDPVQWFEGPNQHGRRVTTTFRHDIHTPVHAVAAIYVGTPWRAKHCRVSRCLAVSKTVSGRVVWTGIGFHLDDATRGGHTTESRLEHAPKQIARDTDGIAREELLQKGAGYSSSGPRMTFWIAAPIRLRSPPSSSDGGVATVGAPTDRASGWGVGAGACFAGAARSFRAASGSLLSGFSSFSSFEGAFTARDPRLLPRRGPSERLPLELRGGTTSPTGGWSAFSMVGGASAPAVASGLRFDPRRDPERPVVPRRAAGFSAGAAEASSSVAASLLLATLFLVVLALGARFRAGAFGASSLASGLAGDATGADPNRITYPSSCFTNSIRFASCA